jgi:putative membrane protein
MGNDPARTIPATTRDRVLAVLMAVLLLAHAMLHGWNIFAPVKDVDWTFVVPVFAGFVFLNALYTMGWPRTLTLFVMSTTMAWACEAYGLTHPGLFGTYYYTGVLGPQLMGVPLVVPLAYFMMIYPSYVITNLMLDGRPTATTRASVGRLAAAAVMTALVMTSWDLTNDPLMADEVKAWVWPDAGPFFGMPLRNFAGWVTVLFVIVFTFRWLERSIPLSPLGPPSRFVVAGTLFGYGIFMLTDTLAGFPHGTRVIPPFAMGIPLLAATMRLFESPAADQTRMATNTPP